MKIKQLPVLFICLSTLLLCVSPAMADDPLTLWVHPYLPATELIKKFNPLAEYLGEKCHRRIEVKVSESYSAHIIKVGEGHFDLAYMGPSSYVKTFHAYGPQTLLARLQVYGKPVFHGVIITRHDSSIETLQDLRGKSFAFGDPNSTMSHTIPLYILREAGISLDELKNSAFLGSHNNVALAVLGGYYDAGGVKEGVFDKYRERGLQSLAVSLPVSEHLFVANKNMDQDLVATLLRSMLKLEDQEVLSSIKESVTGMAPAANENYTFLYEVMKTLDMLEIE